MNRPSDCQTQRTDKADGHTSNVNGDASESAADFFLRMITAINSEYRSTERAASPSKKKEVELLRWAHDEKVGRYIRRAHSQSVGDKLLYGLRSARDRSVPDTWPSHSFLNCPRPIPKKPSVRTTSFVRIASTGASLSDSASSNIPADTQPATGTPYSVDLNMIPTVWRRNGSVLGLRTDAICDADTRPPLSQLDDRRLRRIRLAIKTAQRTWRPNARGELEESVLQKELRSLLAKAETDALFDRIVKPGVKITVPFDSLSTSTGEYAPALTDDEKRGVVELCNSVLPPYRVAMVQVNKQERGLSLLPKQRTLGFELRDRKNALESEVIITDIPREFAGS